MTYAFIIMLFCTEIFNTAMSFIIGNVFLGITNLLLTIACVIAFIETMEQDDKQWRN